MSNMKELRRQQFITTIRRRDKDCYQEKIRYELVRRINQEEQYMMVDKKSLSQDILEHLWNKVYDAGYTDDSYMQFMRQILQFHRSSYNLPMLFDKLSELMNHMRKNNSKNLHDARMLVLKICERVASMAIQHPSFIENIVAQFIRLISNPQNGLESLWAQVGLIRNPAHFIYCFTKFKEYIGLFKELLPVVTEVLKGCLNFCVKSSSNVQISLGINQFCQVTKILQYLFNSYDLGDTDYFLAILTLDAIISYQDHHDPLPLYKAIQFDKFVPHMMLNIKAALVPQQKTDRLGLKQSLVMIGNYIGAIDNNLLTDSDPVKLQAKRLMVSSLLFVFDELFSQQLQLIQSSITNPGSKVNPLKPIVITQLMYCLSNLAAIGQPAIIMNLITFNFIDRAILLSKCSEQKVLKQIGIFIWNVLVSEDSIIVNILFQKNLMSFINIMLEQEKSEVLKIRALLMLRYLINTMQISQQRLFNYSSLRIRQQLMGSNANNYYLIQSWIDQGNQYISQMAEQVFNALTSHKPQAEQW